MPRRGADPDQTQEVPIICDDNLPSIRAALLRLESDLRVMGLGHHADRAEAIADACESMALDRRVG